MNIAEPQEAECVLGWCLPRDYQKLESPQPDSPVHVKINVEILDILSVNDKEFSITMSMYFRYNKLLLLLAAMKCITCSV